MVILNLCFNAERTADENSVIRVLAEWISGNAYLGLQNSDVNAVFTHQNSYQNTLETISGNRAVISFAKFSDNHHQYIALLLEQFDEKQNLKWQVDFIFRYTEGTEDCDEFHISLSRSIIHDTEPADVLQTVYPPDIIKLLYRNHMISHQEQFPKLFFNDAFLNQHKALQDYLDKHIASLVHFEKDASLRDAALRISSPLMEHDVKLSGEQLSEGGQTVFIVNLLLYGIINITQQKNILTWSALAPYLPAFSGSQSDSAAFGKYCYMTQQMAQKMKNTRKSAGMSQAELAQKVHSSSLIISRLETLRVRRVLRSLLNEIERELLLPENAIVSLQGTLDNVIEDAQTTVNPAITTDCFTPKRKGFCRKCGHPLFEDSDFCSNCGAKVIT